MRVTRFDKEKFPGYGECIYCGARDVKLTDEHVVPFGFGGNVELLEASCVPCAEETSKCEREIARNVLSDFRIHANIQTYRPKRRPSELSFDVSLEGSPSQTLKVAI